MMVEMVFLRDRLVREDLFRSTGMEAKVSSEAMLSPSRLVRRV
jgi:hypothetical protein